MSSLHRAQILLESEQNRTLAEIARRDGRNISELVREIMGQYLAELDLEKQRRQQVAFRWAEQPGHSKTHGAYCLAVAEWKRAELWTADCRLVNRVRQQGVSWVHWIGMRPEFMTGLSMGSIKPLKEDEGRAIEIAMAYFETMVSTTGYSNFFLGNGGDV